MTPGARVQAAIELADAVIAATRDDGPPADAIVQRYFKIRRYAGSKDRRAVRELLFRAIRHAADRPDNGRAAIVGLAAGDAELAALFDGSGHGPAVLADGELDNATRGGGVVPAWLEARLSPLVGRDEWPALIERAPLDLRVNAARADRAAMMAAFPGAQATALSPWGLRLPPDSQVEASEPYAAGQVEVQDEGSQLIALACRAADGMTIVDLCAGAGGKALALAAAAPGATIIASDTNRQRLDRLPQRAARAGARITTRLIDAGREAAQLADLAGKADVVLVDAPCSGSGTWRRNPEGRWRLTPARLDRVVKLQSRLLDLAAPLVRPGGALVYATCSLIAAEGNGQVADFLGRRSDWRAQDRLDGLGRVDGAGRLLTPGHDRTDGFFVARLISPC